MEESHGTSQLSLRASRFSSLNDVVRSACTVIVSIFSQYALYAYGYHNFIYMYIIQPMLFVHCQYYSRVMCTYLLPNSLDIPIWIVCKGHYMSCQNYTEPFGLDFCIDFRFRFYMLILTMLVEQPSLWKTLRAKNVIKHCAMCILNNMADVVSRHLHLEVNPNLDKIDINITVVTHYGNYPLRLWFHIFLKKCLDAYSVQPFLLKTAITTHWEGCMR